MEKLVVTLLVIRAFSISPGASMDCVDFHDPTDFSRLNVYAENNTFCRVK